MAVVAGREPCASSSTGGAPSQPPRVASTGARATGTAAVRGGGGWPSCPVFFATPGWLAASFIDALCSPRRLGGSGAPWSARRSPATGAAGGSGSGTRAPAYRPRPRLAGLERAELARLLGPEAVGAGVPAAAVDLRRDARGRRPGRPVWCSAVVFETGTKYREAPRSCRGASLPASTGSAPARTATSSAPTPYSPKFSGFTFQLEPRMAQVIHRYHDRRTRYGSEQMSWGSGRGGSPQNKGLRGQARILRRTFYFAARNRNRAGHQANHVVPLARQRVAPPDAVLFLTGSRVSSARAAPETSASAGLPRPIASR